MEMNQWMDKTNAINGNSRKFQFWPELQGSANTNVKKMGWGLQIIPKFFHSWWDKPHLHSAEFCESSGKQNHPQEVSRRDRVRVINYSRYLKSNNRVFIELEIKQNFLWRGFFFFCMSIEFGNLGMKPFLQQAGCADNPKEWNSALKASEISPTLARAGRRF